eukprot:1801690-Alexandrium_andersonii.AAC.1
MRAVAGCAALIAVDVTDVSPDPPLWRRAVLVTLGLASGALLGYLHIIAAAHGRLPPGDPPASDTD